MQRVNPSVEPNRRNSIHAVAEAAAKSVEETAFMRLLQQLPKSVNEMSKKA